MKQGEKPMTDDLHDIDDFFKDGIDGYTERVPASVWDAVEKDLDRSQAALYKNKYHNAKKLALLLLLICMAGGTYVVIDLAKGKLAGLGQTKMFDKNNLPHKKPASTAANNKNPDVNNIKPVPAKSEANNMEANTAQKENAKKDSRNIQLNTTDVKPVPATIEANNIHEKKAQEKLQNDIAATNKSTGRTIKKLVEKFANDTRKDEATKDVYIHKNVSSTVVKNNEMSIKKPGDANNKMTNKPATMRKDEIKETYYFSQQQTVSLRPGKENLESYSRPQAKELLLLNNYKSILPQLNKIAAKQNKLKTVHEFSLTAFAAPNFSFDRLEDDHHFAGPGRDREEAHKKEQENISFSAGLLLNYTLGKKISIQSGATLTHSSTAIAPKTVYAKDNNGHVNYELNCSSGNAYISPKSGTPVAVGDSANTTETSARLTYITIPAAVSYRIGIGRFSLWPAVGTGFNILLSGKTATNLRTATGKQSTTAPISGLKSMYVDGQLALGIEYGLTRRMLISLRPNAHLGLMSINKETPVKSYPNFFSLEAGVRMRL